MRVYELCEQMQDEIDRLLESLPSEARKIADHLERSSESAGTNLQEGLAAFSPGTKAYHFDVCRRETSECRKAMRRLTRKKFIAAARTYAADNKANALIGTMVTMIKQQEARAQREK